ncbi:GNAT family N-acetyltransferase [Acidovorax sp. GBBC 1281]|nr:MULTISPECIES: GNAT family N-acetyltransferase [unclassified Acidovorax]WCN00222.1 GNAT family N-acetyltransferase [Acidovorax sp. GBBC 1281]
MAPRGGAALTAPAFTWHPVAEADFEPMLALRTAAMRESLERVGRYTPERSRERLRAAFTPEHMQHLVASDGRRMGFVTVLPEGDGALRLQHLYLHPDWQGAGVGAAVLAQVQDRARREGSVLRVTALQRSDANRFYQRHGFVQTGEEDVDVHYEWRPEEGAE